MEKLTTKSINEMTKEERDYLRNETIAADINDLNNRFYELADAQTKLAKDLEDSKADIDTLKKNTDVLCSPFHTHRKRSFMSLCRDRVWSLFDNDKTGYKYAVFGPYFFRRIYADTARHIGVGSYNDISMKDFTEPDSDYEVAKEFASAWRPSSYYIKGCLTELEGKRDNGVLSAERCRALTQYLKETSSGKINLFA